MEFSKIVSVKPIGKIPTLDIEIDSKDHLYYANNIITSNSHAVAYATIGYIDAYCKSNYPLEFFIEQLNNARHKLKPKKEIKEIVEDVIEFGYKIELPTLKKYLDNKKTAFYYENDTIYYGLDNVKGVGPAQIKLLDNIEKNDWWYILNLGLHKTMMTNLICIGFFGGPRKKLLQEYTLYNKLSPKEQEYIRECNGLKEGLEILLRDDVPSKVRYNQVVSLLESLNNPPFSLEDQPKWIFETEEEVLGVGVSYTKTETVTSDNLVTCNSIPSQGKFQILLEVNGLREYTIKKGQSKGKPMVCFTGKDHTGSQSCFMFAEKYIEHQNLLYEGALIQCVAKSTKNGLTLETICGS